MLTRAVCHFPNSYRMAGNGFNAGRSSCANSVARLPSRLRNGRWLRRTSKPAIAWLASASEKNLCFAQRRDDPTLHYLNACLGFGFVPGSIGSCRNDGYAVVLPQVPVSGIQFRLVIAGMRDGGLQVIRHHNLDYPTEKLECPDMGPNPVPQILPRGSLGERVTAGAQHRDEHGGRLDLAGLWVVNRNRRAGVIDKHLLAGAMFLPQHQVEFLQPTPVQVAEPAVGIAFGMAFTPLDRKSV